MTLPAPFLPADVDLRVMDFFPLEVERFRRSRAMQLGAADPAGGFYMQVLWGESWGEVPAGSLENDDLILAAQARCPVDHWQEHKRVALYGWTLCSDGRLYHKVICAKAWKVWQERLKHRHKMASDRTAKANKRAIKDSRLADVKPVLTFPQWVSEEFPATAARLFAAADVSVPAESGIGVQAADAPQPAAPSAPQDGSSPAEKPQAPENVAAKGGRVAATSPNFGATPPPNPSEIALKDKGKDKTLSPNPSRPERSDGQQADDWARAEDFAAYLAAVGQDDAPVRTCWEAWLGVVRELPERALLLAQVAAWRVNHERKERELGRRIRPMGPARLLREGTLHQFTQPAQGLLARVAQEGHATNNDAVRLADTRAMWGDAFDRMVAKVGGETVFLAWFADARLERQGDCMRVLLAKEFQRNWVDNHYRGKLEDVFGCVVTIEMDYGRKAA